MHQEGQPQEATAESLVAESARRCGASDRIDAPNERAVILRPGVMMPDWSVVRDDVARTALSAIFKLIGVGRRKWSGLGTREDRVWRTVIELFAALGRAPSATEIADAAALSPEHVADELAKLRRRDVLVLDGDGRITGAYPFTERKTGHRVTLGGKSLTAMCAIDALGVGPMFNADTEIVSSCKQCGATIHVETSAGGTAIGSRAPQTAVVWAGLHYAEGCSATSLCTVLAFFCRDEHLAEWRAGEPAGHTGFGLSLDAALQLGRAIFAPILRPGIEAQATERAQ